MTLLGLQFELCFLVIKAICIATAIPAKSFHCEVKWWRHMPFSNHERSGWRVKLWCVSVRLLACYKQIQYNSWTKQDPRHCAMLLTLQNMDNFLITNIRINNWTCPCTAQKGSCHWQQLAWAWARGSKLSLRSMVDCKVGEGGTVKNAKTIRERVGSKHHKAPLSATTIATATTATMTAATAMHDHNNDCCNCKCNNNDLSWCTMMQYADRDQPSNRPNESPCRNRR